MPNPYSVNKLMEKTRALAVEYYRTTGKALPVSNELSRYDVGRLLKLELPVEPESGVDFIGTGAVAGLKIQVKSRVIFNPDARYRVGQLNIAAPWELILLLLLDSSYSPLAIYRLGKAKAQELISGPKSGGNSGISVAKFKRVGSLVWDKEIGLIDKS